METNTQQVADSIRSYVEHIRDIGTKHEHTARDLTLAHNYAIRMYRAPIDGDYDGIVWGNVWRVSFDMPRAGNEPVWVAQFDSPADAALAVLAIGDALTDCEGFCTGYSLQTRGPYPSVENLVGDAVDRLAAESA